MKGSGMGFAQCALFLFGCAFSEEQVHDLETGIASWPRLKRDAGYYTESGIWRGGLWRVASNTEHERYECQRNEQTHCAEWTSHEENKKKRETGTCMCVPTESPFCLEWKCHSDHIDFDTDCQHDGPCIAAKLEDTLDCNCTVASENGRYCQAWSCVDSSSNGYSEEEDYECLVEDVSQEYCYRWRGNISSSFEIESSICECFDRGKRFCKAWECRERALIRCAAHSGGWCRLEIALGVGGGISTLLLLVIMVWLGSFPRMQAWWKRQLTGAVPEGAVLWRLCLFLITLIYPVFWVSILLNDDAFLEKSYGKRILSIFVAFLLVCCPWIAGILIWGGVFALLYVLAVWGYLFVAFSCWLCFYAFTA